MSNGVATTSSGLALNGELTSTSLTLPNSLSFDEWAATGNVLGQMERSCMWWIGDWWAFGDHKYGERAAQLTNGEAYQTWNDAGWVSRKFAQLSRRRDDLSWSHHREVASLPEAKADKLLAQAAKEGWSRSKLRDAVKAAKAKPTAIDAPKDAADTTTPEPTYTDRDQEIDNLRASLNAVTEENAKLADAVATGIAPEGLDYEKHIAELREENRVLRATVAALTKARDALMAENAQMKRQLAMNRKHMKAA